MSEQQIEATNQESTPESRIQAAIEAVTPTETQEEAPPEEAEIEAQPGEEPEGGEGEIPNDDDQPLTPGEDNIAESSKLASLARRERRSREQSREREDKISARETELEERLKRADELESRLNSFKNSIRRDPVAALKELGLEDGYADVASALYDEELGENAPEEHKTQREIRALQERLRRFEEEQKTGEEERTEQAKKAETEAFQRKYIGEMETYMKADHAELPYAAALFNESPEDTIQAMYSIAYQVAVEDPNALLPTSQQLAEALNNNLETTLAPVIEAILAARNQTEEAEPPAEEKPVRQMKTLHNQQSRRTTTQSPASTDDERLKRALQALEATVG